MMNQQSQKISVVIVDDHEIVREGIKQVVQSLDEFEVLASCADGHEGLETIKKLKPSIAILDISLPSISGIDIVKNLKPVMDEVKVIMLTRHDYLPYLKTLMDEGVSAYILKDEAVNDLKEALPRVVNGETFISPRMRQVQKNFDVQASGEAYESLTTRESEVLKLVAEGYESKEISKMLFISYHTVKVHRKNIFRKLKAKNTSDLIKIAIKAGLLDK